MRTGGSQEGRGRNDQEEGKGRSPLRTQSNSSILKRKKAPHLSQHVSFTERFTQRRDPPGLSSGQGREVFAFSGVVTVLLRVAPVRIYWEVSGCFSSPCDPHVTLLCLFKRKHTNWPAAKLSASYSPWRDLFTAHAQLLKPLSTRAQEPNPSSSHRGALNVRDLPPVLLDRPQKMTP